jgi:hypothetical protein
MRVKVDKSWQNNRFRCIDALCVFILNTLCDLGDHTVLDKKI